MTKEEKQNDNPITQKKKRFKVFVSGKYYAVYNVIGSRYCIAEEIHSQEAAERIAAIYEEDMP